MRKIYNLLGTVLLLCFCHLSFAQAPASATWSFVNPANEGGGNDPVVVGQLRNAAMTLRNMVVFGAYTGPENTNRIRQVANEMPANQTDTIANTYVQFAVAPNENTTLNVTSIRYDLASTGTGEMRAKVFYSTDPTFRTATMLEGGSGMEDNKVMRDAFSAVNKTVNATATNGQTFYVRIYPWVNNQTAVQTGKYIAIRNMVIAGTTTAGTPAQAKRVGYFTQQKDMDPSASTVADDPIIRMLNADPNINLVVNAVAANATVDLTGYDAIVIQESFSGSSAILSPTGSLGLATITVPFVYNKTYALQAGRALAAGQPGQGVEAPVMAATVPATQQSSPLFSGITFGATNSFMAFKAPALDNGAAPAEGAAGKTYNYNNLVALSAPATLLATVEGIAATGTPVFINDIPSGTVVGSETLKARMIAMGLNFGAMSRDNGTNMTAEGLTLWRNAVYSLVGLAIPTTLVNPGVVTSVAAQTNGSSFSLRQNYPNPSNGSTTIGFELQEAGNIALEVFDLMGKKVATLTEGHKLPGAYEVQLTNKLSAGIYVYRLRANGTSASRRMVISR